MTAPKSQGSETFVPEKIYILNGHIVQGSKTGRKTGLKSNISRYSAS